MKKRFRRLLVATTLMVAALASGIFAACSYGVNQEDIKKKEGYKYCVTYDANGGTFGSNTTRTYALVKENSLTPAPGYVDGRTQASIKLPTRRDFQLVEEAKDDGDEDKNDEAILTRSWFVAKTDDKGNVMYEGEGDEKTAVLESEEPWDFTKNKVTKDITLVAQWREVFRYQIYLVDTSADGVKTQKEIRTYTVEPGDTIIDKLYNKDKTTGTYIRRADYIKVSISNYTPLDFYMDENFTMPLADNYVHPGRHEMDVTEINPDTQKEETTTISTNIVNIYVKCLSGKYDLISNKNVKTLTESSKWYLLEDVDFSEKEVTALTRFNGEILGNGYTIKNMTVSSTAVKPTSGYLAHSIFGTFNGLLENVTFENVALSVQTKYGATVLGEQRMSFFAENFTDAGQMKNVTLSGCRLVYSSSIQVPTLAENDYLWWEAPKANAVQNLTGSVQVEQV